MMLFGAPLVLNYFRIGFGVAFILLIVFAWGAWERGNVAQGELKIFTAATEMVGKQAIQRNKDINDADKKRMADAVSGRDAALKCLHDAKCSGRSAKPLVPPPATGSNTICLDAKAFSAAVERYRGRVRERVIEGDSAQVDAETLLKGWPRCD